MKKTWVRFNGRTIKKRGQWVMIVANDTAIIMEVKKKDYKKEKGVIYLKVGAKVRFLDGHDCKKK